MTVVRAYSSIMCISTSRRTSPSLPTVSRSVTLAVHASANAISAFQEAKASATTAGSATAPLKSALESSAVR